MGLSERVEVGSGGHASVGAVSVLMDVEAVFAGRQATDLTADDDRLRLALLQSDDLNT